MLEASSPELCSVKEDRLLPHRATGLSGGLGDTRIKSHRDAALKCS